MAKMIAVHYSSEAVAIVLQFRRNFAAIFMLCAQRRTNTTACWSTTQDYGCMAWFLLALSLSLLYGRRFELRYSITLQSLFLTYFPFIYLFSIRFH
jgi:hypothetical protein